MGRLSETLTINTDSMQMAYGAPCSLPFHRAVSTAWWPSGPGEVVDAGPPLSRVGQAAVTTSDGLRGNADQSGFTQTGMSRKSRFESKTDFGYVYRIPHGHSESHRGMPASSRRAALEARTRSVCFRALVLRIGGRQ